MGDFSERRVKIVAVLPGDPSRPEPWRRAVTVQVAEADCEKFYYGQELMVFPASTVFPCPHPQSVPAVIHAVDPMDNLLGLTGLPAGVVAGDFLCLLMTCQEFYERLGNKS